MFYSNLIDKQTSLVIPSSYLTTESGEEMLIWDSEPGGGSRRFILIGTNDNMTLLADSSHWFIDGKTQSLYTELFSALVDKHIIHIRVT